MWRIWAFAWEWCSNSDERSATVFSMGSLYCDLVALYGPVALYVKCTALVVRCWLFTVLHLPKPSTTCPLPPPRL